VTRPWPRRRTTATPRVARPVTPTPRGWRRPFGGYVSYLRPPTAWRATTKQVAGLWPGAVGAGVPLSGAPLGDHLLGAGTVCGDPLCYFWDGYISSPSEVVIGLNGQGKTTLIVKQVLDLDAMGVLPLILGDLKGEYATVVAAIGGQVIEVGPGRGLINPLDPGEAASVAARLAAEADDAVLAGNHTRAEKMSALRLQVLAEAHARAVSATSGLVTILRGGVQPEDYEESVIARGVRLLEGAHAGGLPSCPCPADGWGRAGWHRPGCPDRNPALAPELFDLLMLVTEGHPDLHAVAVATDDADYARLTVRLRRSLTALVEGSSRLGDTFSGQTTTPMLMDRPVCVVIAAIDDSQSDLQAAVLLTEWAAGFAMVHHAHVLADAGITERRHRFVVMDEFWRVLRSGSGMVERADALTRLDRAKGVGRAYIFHTMSDLEALPEIDRIKARGMVERSGMLVCFGLPPSEMRLLRGVTHFSRKEEQQITSWTTPPSWQARRKAPGVGKCLIKVAGRPGLPVRIRQTSIEAGLHNTNSLWQSEKADAR
jgi:hypothetical protein